MNIILVYRIRTEMGASYKNNIIFYHFLNILLSPISVTRGYAKTQGGFSQIGTGVVHQKYAFVYHPHSSCQETRYRHVNNNWQNASSVRPYYKPLCTT